MADSKGAKPRVDWEVVEREYRTGIRSLRDIAGEAGCTEGAIRKKAKNEGWERDLTAKINAKAEALVRKNEVRNEVRNESAISEREQIQIGATVLANAVLEQRTDIRRARTTVQRLWELVNTELDSPVEFEHLGELLRSPDENNQDKLNDIYHAAISLPQHVKNAKLLADAIKTLVELERKVLRIDEQRPVEVNPLAELIRAVSGSALPVAQVTQDDDDE